MKSLNSLRKKETPEILEIPEAPKIPEALEVWQLHRCRKPRNHNASEETLKNFRLTLQHHRHITLKDFKVFRNPRNPRASRNSRKSRESRESRNSRGPEDSHPLRPSQAPVAGNRPAGIANQGKGNKKRGSLADCSAKDPRIKKNGGYLLSHGCAVPSARAGLTSLFGMGRGGTPPL